MVNTDFTYKMVLKIVQHINDHFNSILLSFQLYFYDHFNSIINNTIINKKAEIADTVKMFK